MIRRRLVESEAGATLVQTVTETTIDLMRHGEPEGGQRIRGTLDDPLSETGWQQMWEAIGAHRPWSALASSPLQRCRAFAEALGQQAGLTTDIQSGFREIGFGAWEGLSTRELMQYDPHALHRYWTDPLNQAPEGAEQMNDFIVRVEQAWQDLLQRKQGEHILLVCHGGVIRAILSSILEMPREKLWSIDVPYASLSRVVYRHLSDGSNLVQLKFHRGSLI
jgi:broad specificity phosphatase PhoE